VQRSFCRNVEASVHCSVGRESFVARQPLPRVGDKAPEFSLLTADGRPYTLADALGGGQHALLFFMRHLG
jgi:hypothetical protein